MIAGDGKVNIINYPDEEDITIRLSPGCCNVNRLSLKIDLMSLNIKVVKDIK